MNEIEILKSDGWSPEGAKFLADQAEHPTIKRFFATLNNQPFRSPRKPQKRKAFICAKIRKAVFERDAYRCVFCGDWHNLSVDHILPESLGGTLDLDNLQTLCITCNCRKGNRI